MAKLLVIQHAASEGLGTLKQEIELRQMTFDTLHAYDNPVFPSGVELERYQALIVLGGPMSAHDETKYPWLHKEFLILREALRQKMPILGICLGGQMLAKVCGARVSLGAAQEIGWGPIRFDDWFSKRNPLTFQFGPNTPQMVFQWHADTFDIPTEGYRLAWNTICPGQMFAIQGNAFGVQFHPEMTQEMINNWVEHHRKELVEWKIDPYQILEETPKYLPDLQKMCHRFFYGFASLILRGA